MFPDNPCSLLPKFADESYAGIWKLPKELSHLGGGGWNELKTWGEVATAVVAVAEMNIKLKVEVEMVVVIVVVWTEQDLVGEGGWDDGGDGWWERLLLLLLLFFLGSVMPFNLFNRIWIT